ncbi:nucleotidyl transferase AbiEii/AbiGii toxin family protein [Leucobacter insecticola]|uniref:Nucleotidyl transferase AbiEii/AbiGii toxin family protein n=1 Tax=Leucobacter insecticola TaxID=2714934 RepID=A0A6G8FGH9_9MICO|nr:nucleotidyl transferase AbiEii/AbiGii toxin family protein [Leucobacter insecticola]QIM15447.1 nucleotidyl transferase AbiEii/AbiGii toxin family protein [Leucobacter insecticola]
MTAERYASPSAVEAAIRSAAKKAAAADPSMSTGDRIRQEYFRRFLSRVFFDPTDTDWLLKGGTGLLARVGSARATTDVDLFRDQRSVAAALEDLKRAASIDLGDFFRFEYVTHHDGVGGASQQHTDGCQVEFAVYIGANARGRLNVDLVVNVIVTDEPTVLRPANGLELSKLMSNEYRLYPVVDQIADKVSATLALYSGRSSSREWDLVDLVLLAATQPVDSDRLRHAIARECKARGIDMPQTFQVPVSWGRRYAKEAKTVPACEDFPTVEQARAFMSRFLDPVLGGSVKGMAWDPETRTWGR